MSLYQMTLICLAFRLSQVMCATVTWFEKRSVFVLASPQSTWILETSCACKQTLNVDLVVLLLVECNVFGYWHIFHAHPDHTATLLEFVKLLYESVY